MSVYGRRRSVNLVIYFFVIYNLPCNGLLNHYPPICQLFRFTNIPCSVTIEMHKITTTKYVVVNTVYLNYQLLWTTVY